MATISAFEAKTKFGELLDRVVRGEEIIITRHDKPVARIIPEGVQSADKVRQAAEGLEALQKEIAQHNADKPPISWKEFKTLVEEGRR